MVVLPIVSYQVKQFMVAPRNKLIIPVPESTVLEAKGFLLPGEVVKAADEGQVAGAQVVEKDLTLVSNWFNTTPNGQASSSKVTHYLLSIPKLKIREAVVNIGGDELKKNLVQYPGTALPGQLGNTVILGHSVLPAFYNPKDYTTIFSKIPTLEKGDEIEILFDGITYIYVVNDYYEKKPDQVDLMEQKFDRYELSLVTCVPPGTYLRRGVISAYLKRDI